MLNETSGSLDNERPIGAAELTARPACSDSYMSWVAVGAVVAGTVGAVVGLTQMASRRARARTPWEPAHAADLTPPHGDKLRPHW